MGNMELSCQMHGSSSNSGEKNMPAERKGCRRSTRGEGKKKTLSSKTNQTHEKPS